MNEVLAHTFPPSFADGPLSYGMALFSMSLCSALSLAMLLRFWFEARARREAWRLAANPRPEDEPFDSPLTIHRMIVSCFFFMVFIGVTPDAVKYLVWGEVSMRAMYVIQEVDQVLDGLTFIPLVAATLLSTWGMQIIPQQLIQETRVMLRPPTWEVLKPHAKVGAVVLLIAIGVTLAKAGA
jgi:hypothetical protein